MPAHLKATTIGCSVSIPIADGRLVLGTWQGVYLGEHRNSRNPGSWWLPCTGSSRLSDLG